MASPGVLVTLIERPYHRPGSQAALVSDTAAMHKLWSGMALDADVVGMRSEGSHPVQGCALRWNSKPGSGTAWYGARDHRSD